MEHLKVLKVICVGNPVCTDFKDNAPELTLVNAVLRLEGPELLELGLGWPSFPDQIVWTFV